MVCPTRFEWHLHAIAERELGRLVQPYEGLARELVPDAVDLVGPLVYALVLDEVVDPVHDLMVFLPGRRVDVEPGVLGE